MKNTMIVQKVINIYAPLTPEQEEHLEKLKNLKDEDIDFSDIPEPTDEQLKQFKRVNPKRQKAAN